MKRVAQRLATEPPRSWRRHFRPAARLGFHREPHFPDQRRHGAQQAPKAQTVIRRAPSDRAASREGQLSQRETEDAPAWRSRGLPVHDEHSRIS